MLPDGGIYLRGFFFVYFQQQKHDTHKRHARVAREARQVFFQWDLCKVSVTKFSLDRNRPKLINMNDFNDEVEAGSRCRARARAPARRHAD